MYKEDKTNEIRPGQIMLYTGVKDPVGPKNAVGINYPMPGDHVTVYGTCPYYKNHYMLEGYNKYSVHSDFLKPRYINEAAFILNNLILKNKGWQ